MKYEGRNEIRWNKSYQVFYSLIVDVDLICVVNDEVVVWCLEFDHQLVHFLLAVMVMLVE